MNNASFIDQIDIEREYGFSRSIECVGDLLTTPARIIFGRSWQVANAQPPSNSTVEYPSVEGSQLLKSPEERCTRLGMLGKIGLAALLPISLLGIAIKKLSHSFNPSLADKYQLPAIVNSRSEQNFIGRLPPNPSTPNCVNSQQNSRWGELYDVAPIAVPTYLSTDKALEIFDRIITANCNATLLEKVGHYRHYEVTVNIPLLGSFSDDVDIYLDEMHHIIAIRSASRTGYRDALTLDFSQPGANKKRVEALRQAFAEAVNEPRDTGTG